MDLLPKLSREALKIFVFQDHFYMSKTTWIILKIILKRAKALYIVLNVKKNHSGPFLFRSQSCKVEKILKGSQDSIPSPSPSVKIQILDRKVCLKCKGKTLQGIR